MILIMDKITEEMMWETFTEGFHIYIETGLVTRFHDRKELIVGEVNEAIRNGVVGDFDPLREVVFMDMKNFKKRSLPLIEYMILHYNKMSKKKVKDFDFDFHFNKMKVAIENDQLWLFYVPAYWTEERYTADAQAYNKLNVWKKK